MVAETNRSPPIRLAWSCVQRMAFATSPAHIDRGASYQFVLNHVVDVDSPDELFRLELPENTYA